MATLSITVADATKTYLDSQLEGDLETHIQHITDSVCANCVHDCYEENIVNSKDTDAKITELNA